MDGVKIVARRDRNQVLPADALAARLHAALVVPRRRSAEARLEEVVRRKRFEARRQLAVRADEDLPHGGAEIVVRDSLRHGGEVGEGAHVSVEKTHLILPRVQPREVAA
jgi:hypothetical protein